MKDRISGNEISIVLERALKEGIISGSDSSALFYDITFLQERFNEIKKIFPSDALHTAAIKASPFVNILKTVNYLGAGFEAASLPEIYLAEKTGCPGNKIIFDSPAKTIEELEYAINLGAHINADSLEELEIIDSIIKGKATGASFGLRVNPQAGTGRIIITSVAGEYSKFGVPVKEFRNEIIEAYLKYDWLRGIHLHVGSQGCPIELLLKGVGTIYELAVEINKKLAPAGREINIFDLGGGFPVSYKPDEEAPSIYEYASALKNKFPLLFSDKFRLITEFGRFYFANSSFAVSRIDNIKKQKDITTIISHLGADFLIRRVYNPEYWHHEISVAHNTGAIKTGMPLSEYVIGGPLCFAGDVIAKNILLPTVENGDYLIIHDTGAYTYSMWSRYNSRQMPKVIGYFNGGEKFVIIKERESLDDILKFWS